MDIDVFVATHRAEWDRLTELVRRGNRLRGQEADELVALYQRVATHLSIVRSSVPDPALLGRLSSLVAKARSAVTGSHSQSWQDIGRFFAVSLPAAIYQSRRWWLSAAILFTLVGGLLAAWVASNPDVQASIAAPDEIRELTEPGGQFETYYTSAPASSFAAQVWTNNAFLAAGCLVLGVLLGVPVIFILLTNAANVAVAAGLMAAAGRLDIFLGLIMPHGLLELTALFVAAGTGLRLGWTVIDPGRQTRAEALARQGRAAGGIALGLVVVLLISGVIEAFVTPSGLPTWARIGIGVGIRIDFSRKDGDAWRLLKTVTADENGRVDEQGPLMTADTMAVGRYELLFYVEEYYKRAGVKLTDPAFLDTVPVRFAIFDAKQSYHVPLYFSPWGILSYRGS